MTAACRNPGRPQPTLKHTPPANVILIVCDTLRADYVSALGDRARTPHLDALARSGILFEHAYSHAPITGPSHASMFTSLLPHDHGVHRNGQILADRNLTLAEILSKSRHTAAFISLGALSSKFHFNQGFDEYHDHFDVGWWKNGAEMNAEVMPWLKKHAHKPFFLFMHYSDPHEPYAPPVGNIPTILARFGDRTLAKFRANGSPVKIHVALPAGKSTIEFVREGGPGWPARLNDFSVFGCKRTNGRYLPTIARKATETPLVLNCGDKPTTATVQFRPHTHPTNAAEKRAAYRGEVEYVDGKIGALLAEIDKLGIRDNTLIVFAADHGEELGEHTPYFGHVFHLYQILIHVPLILSAPGRLPAGVRVAARVRLIDIMPTILHVLHIKPPPHIRGKSLLPLSKIGHRPVVSETYVDGKDSILIGHYKYIYSHTKKFQILYDLDKDPGEFKNVVAQHPKIAAKAKRELELILNRGPLPALKPTKANMTPAEKEELRELGYTE